MPATVEWTLKKEIGPDRWAKFPTASADEAPRSLALVFQWLKLHFATPVRDANFPADILTRTKSVADSIKAKPFAADPMVPLGALAEPNGLHFTKLAHGANNAIELNKALKGLESASAIIYLHGATQRRYSALAIGGPKTEKQVFDPYKGQVSSRNVTELADYVFTNYGTTFDTFHLVKAEALAPAVSAPPAGATPGGAPVVAPAVQGAPRPAPRLRGPAWDWDFDQGAMIKDLATGRYRTSRKGGKTLQQMFPAGECQGICCAMAYDWLKTVMGGHDATSAAYLDPRKFLVVAQDQVDSNDGSLTALQANVATREGYRITNTYTKATEGEFKKATKDLIFKIDQLPAGGYFLGFWGTLVPNGPQVGHRTAFVKKDKTTGKFFDANIGQCTVHPDGESLGALVGAVLLDFEFYKKTFVDVPAKASTLIGTYRISPIAH